MIMRQGIMVLISVGLAKEEGLLAVTIREGLAACSWLICSTHLRLFSIK
jgi:hypothetical protein